MRAPIKAEPFYPAIKSRFLNEVEKAPYVKKQCASCGYVRDMPRKATSCGACLDAYGREGN